MKNLPLAWNFLPENCLLIGLSADSSLVICALLIVPEPAAIKNYNVGFLIPGSEEFSIKFVIVFFSHNRVSIPDLCTPGGFGKGCWKDLGKVFCYSMKM